MTNWTPWKTRLVCCLATMTIGCVGTEVGNPQDTDTSEVEVQFTAYERTEPTALTLSSGVVIDEAWLVFEGIELRETSVCTELDGEEETEPDEESELGVFAVELIGGQEFPTVPTRAKQLVEFCRIEFEVGAVEAEDLPEGAPAELADLSVLVRGQTADEVPFELRGDFGEEFRLDGPFALRAERDALFIAFDAGGWFDSDALDDAEVSGNAIIIDDENNSTILDDFRDAIKESAALFRDSNRDGALQETERSEPLARSVAP